MYDAASPLSSHQVADIQNISCAQNFIESTLNAKIIHCSKHTDGLHIKASHYSLENIDVWHCSYKAPITIQFPESDFFRVQFHHKGAGATKVSSGEYAVAVDQAVISHSATQIDFGAGFEQTVLRFNSANLTRKILALTGALPRQPLEFSPTFDPTSPNTSRLKRGFDYLLHEVNNITTKMPRLMLHEMEQMLTTSFLCLCPNSYTYMLERQAMAAAPSQVCLVEDYIEANWDLPITIERIAEISGCSVRSIQRAFQKYRGYSPMSFARQVRLRHARKMLLSGMYNTVTEVAFACGHTELGRFSHSYASMFEELPSDTIKRRPRL